MQGSTIRYLILTAVLSAGALAFAALSSPASLAPRLPTEEELFFVGGWNLVGGSSGRIDDTAFITREYVTGGAAARFVLKTGTAAKAVYRAGPEVPFLGSGFSVTPAPAKVQPMLVGMSGLIAQRGDESYLIIYAYGGRRGVFGNGPLGWSLATVDGVAAQPNDYYLMTLLAPFNPVTPEAVGQTAPDERRPAASKDPNTRGER